MLKHYVRLGLDRLFGRLGISALLFVAIALATAASLTTNIVVSALTADPIPGRSAHIFYPHLDPLPAKYRFKPEWGDPTTDFSWPDAMAILRSHIGSGAAAMSGGEVTVYPQDGKSPFRVFGRFTTVDFFKIFRLKTISGRVWSARDDADRAPVIVLAESLKQKLFGTGDCIGKTIVVSDHAFTIVGVTKDWAPRPLFYADAADRGGFNEKDVFFLPLATAVDYGLDTTNADYGWGPGNGPKSSNKSWLQVWVELDTPHQVAAMRRFLYNYSSRMLASGNYERPPAEARLFTLGEWLQKQHLVPPDIKLQFWISQIFLITCIINIAAVLLAVFLKRQQEMAIRRALGATRSQISFQILVEVMLLGIPAGALGALLAAVALGAIRMNHPEYADVAHMSPLWAMGSVILAMAISALGAGIPILRLNYAGITGQLAQEA